jgi:hypothetical protein
VKSLITLDDVQLTALEGEDPRAQVARAGTTWTVDGSVLEGAWSFGAELLIATTDNIPYEEGLRFSLLSPDGSVVDEVELSHMYATGSFTLLGTEGATLRFRFFGGTDWLLRVCESPRVRVPFLGDPRGVGRPWGFSKRLLVEGNPKPEGKDSGS